MWKTAITCGILAFVTATMTLWVLGNLFPPTREVPPIRQDLELSLSDRDRYGRPSPLHHDLGPGSATVRARTGDLNTATGVRLAPPAAPPHGESAQPEIAVQADRRARALLAATAQGAGFELVNTSNQRGIAGVAKGEFPLAIVSRQPSPRERQQAIGVESLGHFVPTIVVHPDNPLRGLDLLQTRNLLAGRIEDWSEIGGQDGRVKLLLPTGKDQRNAYANALISGDSLSRGIPSSNDPLTRLRLVAQDRHAVTLVPLPLARDSGLPMIRIADQTPGVGSGYQFTREFFLITGPRTQTEAARRALAAVRGPNNPFGSVLVQL